MATAHRTERERIRRGETLCYAVPPADLLEAGVPFAQRGLPLRRPRRRDPGLEAGRRGADGLWELPADWPRSSALLGGRPERFDYVTRKLAVSYSDAAARRLWSRGRIREALPWFLDAARVGFDFPGARINAATALAANGAPDRALDELLAACRLAPYDPEPPARLAVFLATAGRPRDAAVWFERAYEASPPRRSRPTPRARGRSRATRRGPGRGAGARRRSIAAIVRGASRGPAGPGGEGGMSGARDAAGFTLVELALAITIVAILAWLAYPKIADLGGMRLDAAARRVAGDLRYAQSRAIGTRTIHGLHFEPSSGRYTVYAPTPSTPLPDPADRARTLRVVLHDQRWSTAGCDHVGVLRHDADRLVRLLRRAARQRGTDLAAIGRVVLSYQGPTDTVDVTPGTGKVDHPMTPAPGDRPPHARRPGSRSPRSSSSS